MPRKEFGRLNGLAKAGELPPLPEADDEGNRPALEYVRATIARDIIRERKALGLTQEQLAKLAGVRAETLSRLESAKHSPTVRTVERIDRALKRAATRHRKGGRSWANAIESEAPSQATNGAGDSVRPPGGSG